MELKDFAIWNEFPNYSIATGSPLPKDIGKIGVSLSLIVTEIPAETSLNDAINKLRKTKYAALFTPEEKTRGEFNSSGFREAWPHEVSSEEAPFRFERPDRVVAWGNLE